MQLISIPTSKGSLLTSTHCLAGSIFESLKNGFIKVRTAVADRNN